MIFLWTCGTGWNFFKTTAFLTHFLACLIFLMTIFLTWWILMVNLWMMCLATFLAFKTLSFLTNLMTTFAAFLAFLWCLIAFFLMTLTIFLTILMTFLWATFFLWMVILMWTLILCSTFLAFLRAFLILMTTFGFLAAFFILMINFLTI